MQRVEETRQKDNELRQKEIEITAERLRVEQANKLLELAHHADFSKYIEAVASRNTPKADGEEQALIRRG
jgi:hypothetical protein